VSRSQKKEAVKIESEIAGEKKACKYIRISRSVYRHIKEIKDEQLRALIYEL